MPKPAKKPTKKAAKTTRARKPDAYPYPGADIVSGMRRHRKVSIVLAVLVGALLVWWGFNAIKTEVQFRQDKKQYAAAEASMAEVYSQMVGTTGTPTESHLTKTCGHISLKYETGPLFCDITYDFFYSVNTSDDGRAIAEVLGPKLKAFSSNGQVEKGFQPEDTASQKQDFHIVSTAGLTCSLNYESETMELHNLGATTRVGAFTKSASSPFVAKFVFDCNSFPAKPLYKIVKD